LKLLKKVLQLVAVVAALAMLLSLLNRLGWPMIANAFSRVGWISAVLLVMFVVAEVVCDALALRIITGPSLRVGFAIALNTASSLMNLILPWESGEVLKVALLRGSVRSSHAVSSTIIWNYIFKVTRPTLSMAAALLAVLLCRTTPIKTLGVVILANLLAFVPYLLLRFAIRFGATEKIVNLMRHLPYLRRSPTHWAEIAKTIDTQVRAFWRERPWAYVQVFALQLLARTTGWLNIYVGCRAVGLPYGIDVAALLYATMNVAEYVIALLPARVGVSEGTAFFVFRYYGLDASMGLVVYTFLRVRNIAVSCLIAPFAFLGRGAGTPVPPAVDAPIVSAVGAPAADSVDGAVDVKAEPPAEPKVGPVLAP
jgi:hypothetical protein